MDTTILKYLAAGGVGLLVGAGGTYLGLNRYLAKKWQAIADEQVLSVKENYRIIRKEGILADPENLVTMPREEEPVKATYPTDPAALQALADELVDAGYVPVRDAIESGASDEELIQKLADRREEERRAPVTRNAFDNPIPEGADGYPRDPNHPYVITIDEWAAPEDDMFDAFETVTIKYFAGDSTLLDSKGGIELDVDNLVGVANLMRFGDGSQDPDVVYIRNERLSLHLEVIRLAEGYAESRGLSFDPEEEDGHSRARAKFKKRLLEDKES